MYSLLDFLKSCRWMRSWGGGVNSYEMKDYISIEDKQ